MTEILDYAASAETGASPKELLVQEAIEYSRSDDLAASMIDLRIRDIESSQTLFTQVSPAKATSLSGGVNSLWRMVTIHKHVEMGV